MWEYTTLHTLRRVFVRRYSHGQSNPRRLLRFEGCNPVSESQLHYQTKYPVLRYTYFHNKRILDAPTEI